MVFPMWARLALAIVIAAIDYTQTTTLITLSPVAQYGIGLASVIAGVLLAFQNTVVAGVRRLRGS